VARCRECAGRRLAFARARSAVAYDRATRSLVRGWKERGLRRLAGVAADLVVDVVEPPAAAVVTWVPPVHDRVLERGHSTAQQLARELARRWDREPRALLERTRFVAPQRGLDLAERRGNVRGAFQARSRVPARVCLVDDVYTTGATASAAASALRRAGAREVAVVTLARTLRRLDCREKG
jgi:predicted amidophosphoribosyltransferase